MGTLARLKLRWKYRRYKRTDWPYHYVGPTDIYISHGLPLQRVPGPKGAVGGGRYLSPDGIVRLVNRKDVKPR